MQQPQGKEEAAAAEEAAAEGEGEGEGEGEAAAEEEAAAEDCVVMDGFWIEVCARASLWMKHQRGLRRWHTA